MRIVTLAQLRLLKLGAIVSPIQIEDRSMVFDVQGTLQLKPTARVTGRGADYLVLVDVLPDIRIEEGRIKTNPSETYHYESDYPKRYVVWKEIP